MTYSMPQGCGFMTVTPLTRVTKCSGCEYQAEDTWPLFSCSTKANNQCDSGQQTDSYPDQADVVQRSLKHMSIAICRIAMPSSSRAKLLGLVIQPKPA